MNEEQNQFVIDVQEQIDIAKAALQKIIDLSKGKDGNVRFLASYELSRLDSIVKCAKIVTDKPV